MMVLIMLNYRFYQFCAAAFVLLNYCLALSNAFDDYGPYDYDSYRWIIREEQCRTPDKTVGTCVVYEQCPFILHLLQTMPRPFSPMKVLKKYECGFEGMDVKVCCPSTEDSVTTATTITTPLLTASPVTMAPNGDGVPDVTSHRNLGLLPNECGQLQTDNKIINGNRTSLYEFPWMALLRYQRGDDLDFRCGGSIVSSKYILTAAHCVTNLKNLKLVSVRVGEHDISTEEDCELDSLGKQFCSPPVQDLGIDKVFFHPGYNSTIYQNDLALIRVDGQINFEPDNIKPICLPVTESLRTFSLVNKKLMVTGWGATESEPRSSILLKVRVPVRNHDDCVKIYASQAPITFTQVCAGGVNSMDSCGGDSGGPLQTMNLRGDDELSYIQYGVVSFGPRQCGLVNSPGVYTNVVHYCDWILDNMEP